MQLEYFVIIIGSVILPLIIVTVPLSLRGVRNALMF